MQNDLSFFNRNHMVGMQTSYIKNRLGEADMASPNYMSGCDTMIVYRKLFELLDQRGLKKIDLRKAGIHPMVVDKLVKNKSVTITTIDKLCDILDCQPGDIMEHV